MARELVLEVGYEGGSFTLYADLGSNPEAFFFKAIGDAAYSWAEVLEGQLRPNRWLILYPVYVHPMLRARVREELRQSGATNKHDEFKMSRWRDVLGGG